MANLTWTVNGKKIPLPKPFPGIPPFPWETKEAFVRDFVSRHGLTPATQQITLDGRPLANAPLWWKYGGPRDPHLHLGNEIYMLDRAKWKEFTQGLAQSMGIEIDRAKKIDFADLAQKATETELLKSG